MFSTIHRENDYMIAHWLSKGRACLGRTKARSKPSPSSDDFSKKQ